MNSRLVAMKIATVGIAVLLFAAVVVDRAVVVDDRHSATAVPRIILDCNRKDAIKSLRQRCMLWLNKPTPTSCRCRHAGSNPLSSPTIAPTSPSANH